MKKFMCFALFSIVFLNIGCGDGVPSASPNDSSDEALVLSAFDYQAELMQKFIMPRIEEGTKKYIKYLTKKLEIVGGEQKVQIAEDIEMYEKIQRVFPEYNKRWNDAGNEIIERKEATEEDIRKFINMRLSMIFRNVQDGFDNEFKLLDAKYDDKIKSEENSTKKYELRDNKTKEEQLVLKKIAGEFSPKANDFIKKLGFKDKLFKIEDVSNDSYRPTISRDKKLPYEVLINFRIINTNLKFPKFTKDNKEYSVIMDSRTEESLVFQVDEKWHMAYFHSNDMFSNFDFMSVLSNPLFFTKQDFDTGIDSVENSAKIAGRLYFLNDFLQNIYNVELNKEMITLNLILAKWRYDIDEKEFNLDNERFEFLKDNIDALESCEVTIKKTELKKITAEVDINIKFMTIEENDGKVEKKSETETAKYKLTEKTIYRRVFLNLIDNEWRIIKDIHIDEPKEMTDKVEE
ncbi:MAG: hypothetical protein K8S87_03025 [Planctomycetes bacterium]|nr:hypothetical protein [Planctomycetota bacterium]